MIPGCDPVTEIFDLEVEDRFMCPAEFHEFLIETEHPLLLLFPNRRMGPTLVDAYRKMVQDDRMESIVDQFYRWLEDRVRKEMGLE